MAQPRILLLAVGGTIATVVDDQGRVAPVLTGEELLRALPQTQEIARVTAPALRPQSSRAMTPELMRALAQRISEEGENFDGVVVTHGTDTLEETAYALACMLPRRLPVVLTGAMRQPGMPGADGPANLLAALQVASVPSAASMGAVVVMADQIHLARFVAKTHTAGVNAFRSPDLGPIGSVTEGRVHLSVQPLFEDYLGLPAGLPGRVELLWVVAGSDGELVRAISPGLDGLVVAGTGGGHVPPPLADALAALVDRGIPVVLASRTGAGPILRHTYGGPGSEQDLLGRGLLPAGALSPLKARIRLLVALGLGLAPGAAFPVE